MAVLLYCFPKNLMICTLAFTVTVAPFDNQFASGRAKAQNLIERVMSGNEGQKTYQRREKKKRAMKQEAPKHSPTSSSTQVERPGLVPIPTPPPRRDAPVAKQKELSKPVSQTPEVIIPLPEKKPPETQEQIGVNPEKSAPTKNQRIYQVSCPALMKGDVEGKLILPIDDGPQCGAHSPLSITAIGRVEPLKFANAITTNCAMAVTLANWANDVKDAAKLAYGNDVKVMQIGTGSDYQCRNVNGASEGRVSEHAFANALDIMSFKFSDGSKTELESGWNGSEKEKKFWRAVHGASCKLFMTVIGPDGDEAHRTNMHLDQGCHGKSCLARICQ